MKEKEDLLCSVTDGRKRYDLSALARHSGRALAPRGALAACSRKPFLASSPVKTFGNAVPFFCNCQLSVSWPILPFHAAVVQIIRNDAELGGKIPEFKAGMTLLRGMPRANLILV